MDQSQTSPPAEQPAPQREVSIPWFYVVIGMLVIAVVIIVVFSGPLNTSPDQTYHAPTEAPAK